LRRTETERQRAKEIQKERERERERERRTRERGRQTEKERDKHVAFLQFAREKRARVAASSPDEHHIPTSHIPHIPSYPHTPITSTKRELRAHTLGATGMWWG
jgi:predicted phage gp36 major capsid-like protein